MKGTRSLIWLQIIVMWVPMWALYALLIASAHESSLKVVLVSATWAIVVAALLGIPVRKLTRLLPPASPISAKFIAGHLAGAVIFSLVWMLLTFTTIAHTSGAGGTTIFGFSVQSRSFTVMGAWLYLIIAGASYGMQAVERAGKADALAAKSQLATLRSQLNPHFLFNALHTVIHLIPREPRLAANAAEQLAGLLRTGIEEDRDLIPLSKEIEFVERYLSIERIRFGDRLNVVMDVDEAAKDALVPSFSVQSLVENSVRHGVEPSETPTSVNVGAVVNNGALQIEVRDTGPGATEARLSETRGTGLSRLRERLIVLYGDRATLDASSLGTGGFLAKMTIPIAYGD